MILQLLNDFFNKASKIDSVCASEDLIKRVKRQFTAWDKLFANHILDKSLVCRKYKELLQLNNKKTNNSIKNLEKEIGKGLE